jgi:hypothetical protein
LSSFSFLFRGVQRGYFSFYEWDRAPLKELSIPDVSLRIPGRAR